MNRARPRDLAAFLGAAALIAGGWYAYRRWRALEHRRAEESELLVETYIAYSEGSLGQRPNGHHRKRRRWLHTEPREFETPQSS